MLGHNDYNFLADSAYYPILYKTIDGGATWTGPINIPLSGASGLSAVKNYIADSTLAKLFTSMPDRDSILFTTAFNHDLVVDANGNPHICVAIGVGSGSWSIFSGLTSSTDDRGFIGVFDIYSPDGGTSWNAINWALTDHFRGYFPGGATAPTSGDYISEDLRPQVSRTMDGTKLFFSWLDTDFLTFAGLGNSYPDIHCRGLDVTNMNKTDHYVVTAGTQAEYLATFGSQSHYVFSSAGEYTIPFVYQQLDNSGDPAHPVQFYYLDGFTITDADFVPNPGIVENDNISAVSQNYPNPFTGSTQIDVELKISSQLSLQVHNVMGQLIYSKDFGKQRAGKHTLIIPADNMVQGIYLYTVKAGKFSITNKMIVE